MCVWRRIQGDPSHIQRRCRRGCHVPSVEVKVAKRDNVFNDKWFEFDDSLAQLESIAGRILGEEGVTEYPRESSVLDVCADLLPFVEAELLYRLNKLTPTAQEEE